MKREIELQFQAYIPAPPVKQKDLIKQATGGDDVTVESWFDIWLKQMTANAKSFDFESLSAMQVHGTQALKPVIIAGSGPSLKYNVDELAKNKGDICLVSCLHNFGFFEDKGVHPDYYVHLDAGPITIEEVSQGGTKSAEEYWEATKNHTLVTAVVSHPEILKRWKGKILFYNITIPNGEYIEKMKAITPFDLMFSVGGNTLGAALYFAKAILGGNPITFIGADFCFGYDRKFHPFNSPYDQKFDGVIPVTDVFGNRVYTWPSYWGFKCWFDYICCGGAGNNPGVYINCSEGGTLGAYAEGNIRQITQMSLKEFLDAYRMHKEMPSILEKQKSGMYQFLF
jgi:hypothetical protein